MDDVDSCISMLLAGDRDARADAADRLARRRDWDLSRLGPVLVHPHASRRIKAIQVLRSVPPARRVEAIALILPSLADEEYIVREKARIALARIGHASPDRIAAALSNAEGRHRLDLLEVLSRLGDERAVAPLTAMLDAPQPDLREGAIRNLGRFRRAPTSGVLLPRLRDPSNDVRRQAIRTMGILARPELSFALVNAYFDHEREPLDARPVSTTSTPFLYRDAIFARKGTPLDALHHAVQHCAREVPGAMEHIIERARDGDLALRERASALFQRLLSHRPARDRFLALFERDEPEIRDTCLQIVAYSHIAGEIPKERALPLLLLHVEDEDVRRRVFCARALSQVQPDPRAAEAIARLARDPLTIAALSQWLKGPDPLLRRHALDAARILRSMELFGPLLEALMQSATLPRAIEVVVTAYARDSYEAFEATLWSALTLPARQRQCLAVVICDCLRESSERRERFQSLLENADPVARTAYVEVLDEFHAVGYLPEERAAEALLPVLGDEDATVRFRGARILGVIERVPRVAQALAALAADPATPETLLAWLVDPDPRVRCAASATMRVLRRAEFRGPLLDALLTDPCGARAHAWSLAAYAPDVIDMLVRRPVVSIHTLRRLYEGLQACLNGNESASADRCLELLAHSDATLRDACLRLLGVNVLAANLPTERLLSVLLPLSRDEDPRCRSRCFHILALWKYSYDPRVLAAVNALENDPDAGVRDHVTLLRRRESRDVCPCEREGMISTRWRILGALGPIKPAI